MLMYRKYQNHKYFQSLTLMVKLLSLPTGLTQSYRTIYFYPNTLRIKQQTQNHKFSQRIHKDGKI